MTFINNDETTTTRRWKQMTITGFFFFFFGWTIVGLHLTVYYKKNFEAFFSLQFHVFIFVFVKIFKDFSLCNFIFSIFCFCIANPDLCASRLWIPKKRNPLFQFTIKVSSLQYMSPKVVLGECYNKTADVYAPGHLCWRWMKRPYKTIDDVGNNNNINKNRVAEGHSRSSKTKKRTPMRKRCLSQSQKRRRQQQQQQQQQQRTVV